MPNLSVIRGRTTTNSCTLAIPNGETSGGSDEEPG